MRQSGDSKGAIAQYTSILQQSTDTPTHSAVFKALEDIGAENLEKATSPFQTTGIRFSREICDSYELAHSAYEPVVKAQDWGTFAEDRLLIPSATVDEALMTCHLEFDNPKQSYTQVIKSALDNLAVYPHDSNVTDILIQGILDTYKKQAADEYTDKMQEVLDNGQLINARLGDYKLYSKDVPSLVHTVILDQEYCKGNPVQSTSGTSTIKRVYACTLGDQNAVDQAGLASDDPAEIWFILEGAYGAADDVKCSGYYTDAGTNFTYSYLGQAYVTYTLKDVHTGKVMATKTLWGTAPRCVFTTCTLDTFSNTATCTGGEGHSTFDSAELTQWLKGVAR